MLSGMINAVVTGSPIRGAFQFITMSVRNSRHLWEMARGCNLAVWG